MKDNIQANQKLILSVIVALSLFFADLYLVIKPVIGGLAKILPEVSAKSSRVKIMMADVKNEASYQEQIKNLEIKLAGHKSRFSTKEEISPLLKNLSDTAKACGVKIVSINPVEKEEKDKNALKEPGAYRKFPIYLDAISGYHAFGLFLNKLENSDIFMRVANVKIQGGKESGANHKFSVSIVTYIFSAPEEAKEQAATPGLRVADKTTAGAYVYDALGKRDPFMPLVNKEGKITIDYGAAVASTGDIKLEGIVYDPAGGSIAIINGVVLRENDAFGNIKLIKIRPDKVHLVFNQKEYIVELEKEE